MNDKIRIKKIADWNTLGVYWLPTIVTGTGGIGRIKSRWFYVLWLRGRIGFTVVVWKRFLCTVVSE